MNSFLKTKLKYTNNIKTYLNGIEEDVYPKEDKIFRVFQLSLNDIKVSILGQDNDPDGSAAGLAFSVENKNKRLNKSLLNIFTELMETIYRKTYSISYA